MAAILGINISHYASAAIIRDGKIIAAVGEERMNRVKNWAGFPEKSIREVLHLANLSGADIDEVAIGTRCERFDPLLAQGKEYRPLTRLVTALSRIIPTSILGSVWLKNLYIVIVSRHRARQYQREFSAFFSTIGIPWAKIKFYDHHECHAAVAHFFKPWAGESLVFTNDGLGDGLCATVSIGRESQLLRYQEITAIHSLGGVYSRVTRFLGLRPWNDEYKVMGLAPYANPEQARPVVDLFRSFFRFREEQFELQLNALGDNFIAWLNTRLANNRFDHIALGVQTMLEEIGTAWVRCHVQKHGIKRITLAGGVGLNVKANKAIAELPELDDIFVFPAAGDDSISIGAALLAERNRSVTHGRNYPVEPLHHLYLGSDIAEDVEDALAALDPNEFSITQPVDLIEIAADLLADGQVVARAAGRMEYGPRALGNRSILSDPARLENVQWINRAIKNRDFWMPFAPVILDRCADQYLINPKKIRAPFMILAFDTRPEFRRHIRAAIHQADFTARPQILERPINPDYYDLIAAFEKRTGIGALLNTSFNLHGFPIVRTAREALDVFARSGLNFMILDNFLIQKNRWDDHAE